MILAIDGPAGAGKSTVSRLVAQRLGFQLLDTGAIYRSVAWMARQEGVAWDDGEGLARLAAGLQIRFELSGETNAVFVSVDGQEEEVTREVRAPEIGQGASEVSAHPPVRAALLELQRRIGRSEDSVVEGRDIGTVVFPDAEVKVFLTASVEERARRRYAQYMDEGIEGMRLPEIEVIEAEIRERDARDMGRAVAPLSMAADAVLVDCTALSQGAVVEAIAAQVEEKLKGG